MHCPTCQLENLPDSLFCTECGAKMEVSCTACGGTNPPAAKFCRQCGAALTGVESRQSSSSTRRRSIPRPEAALAEAEAWIEMSGATSDEPFLHVERAALARLSGDDASRQREWREAHRLFAEMGAPIRVEQVAKELGQ